MIGETFYKINRDPGKGAFSEHPFLGFIVRGIDKDSVTDLYSDKSTKIFFNVLILGELRCTTSPQIEYHGRTVRINIGELFLPSEYKDMIDILAKNGYYQKDSEEYKKEYINLCTLHTEELDKRNKSLQLEIQKNQETIKKLKDELL